MCMHMGVIHFYIDVFQVWVILHLAYAQSLNQINYNQYKTYLPFSSKNLKV
jgi:hypothetical protein